MANEVSRAESGPQGSQVTRRIYRQLRADYLEAYEANLAGDPVAWVTAYSPVEILIALGIKPVFPENYASFTAAKQKSVEFQMDAEAMGFSKDCCSYFRTVSGGLISGKSSLPHPFPKPDILLAHTGICDVHVKWMEFSGKQMDRPVFVIDVPYNHQGLVAEDLPQSAVDYYVGQIENLITFLEKRTGLRMDLTRLKEVVARSDETSRLWLDICDLRRSRPCPIGARDTFTDVYLLLGCAGRQVALDLMRELNAEVKARVEAGQGVVPVEQYRLLFDMVPAWYNMKLFDYFSDQGAVFVAEYFNLRWACRMDPERPLESLARKYMSITWGNLGLPAKTRFILDQIRRYQNDGVVLFSAWSCRPYMVGQMDLKREIEAQAGIPVLLLDSDQADPRHYSAEQVQNRVDAFIETMACRQ